MRSHSSWRRTTGAFLLGLAGASALSAQPHLVVDLNRQSARVDFPFPFSLEGSVEHDGARYFIGHDPQHGDEIWRTDGTPDGTSRLVDLCPGSCGSESEPLTFFHGSLYFLGDDGEHGREIWRTDGTVGGEELLTDVCQGPCWAYSTGWAEWRGELWFLIQEASDRIPVLWASDGTREGTRQVANLCTDLSLCESGSDPSIFLTGPDPSGQGLVLRTPTSLVRTDGTAGGTVLLHRFTAGFHAASDGPKRRPASRKTDAGGSARIAAAASEPLYFIDRSSLWTTDGTPSGTHLVRNLDGLVQYASFRSTRVVDGILYAIFEANEWLRSDGTAEGTFLLAQVGGATGARLARIGSSVVALIDGEIWRTGGRPETTSPFAGPLGEVLNVVEQADRLLVMSFDPHRGSFIWSTDGTPAGTQWRHAPGRHDPRPGSDAMVAFADGVLFTLNHRELWRFDDSGTERLHDFETPNGGSGPSDQVVLGNRLLFFSLFNAFTSHLFSSDGTSAGTTTISTAPGGWYFEYDPYNTLLTRAGKRVLFNSSGRLFATDGSREGTRLLKPPTSSNYRRFNIAEPIGLFGDRFVFSATLDINDGAHCYGADSEPWVSDGTGTKQLLNLNPYFHEPNEECAENDFSSDPGRGVALGRIALFSANDFVHGRELFATDGTKEGTRLVADINRKRRPYDDPDLKPHPLQSIGVGSDPSDLVRAGSNVFFTADDGTTGRELWISNGNRRGTRRVADLAPGPGSSTPHDLVAIGNAIYFFAAHGEGDGLYRSDGTAGGTVLVSDLAGVSQARDLIAVKNGRLYFAAFTEAAGTELWTSQGTAATTHLVTDLRPGPRGSAPQKLKVLGDRAIFAADDGISGLEPWSSDGTPEGTVRLGDIAPGRDASTPGPFSIANGQILFGADDGEHGRELWAIPVAQGHE